jgi:acid phosphatase family membrane protein YuiD
MEEETKWRLERLKKVNLIRNTMDDTIMGEKKLKEVLGHTPVQVRTQGLAC